ncbi:MAG: hypothetical protein U0637_12935 [Phycisphaerales bacterium]
MHDAQTLLHFRGQALTQFLLVATIFGAFAMGGVIALIAHHEKQRLRSFLFIVLSVASMAFVLASALSVLVIPFATSSMDLSDRATDGLNTLYRVAVDTMMLGMALLAVGLGALGFMVSRRAGVWTLGASGVTTIAFIFCAAYLSHILK